MTKPIQAKYLAPYLHALLFLAMWGLGWAFALPMLNGPSVVPFVVLFIADFPISVVAFGVMFTSVKFGLLAAVLWGVVGTLWWYFIGQFIDARIRNSRKIDYTIAKQTALAGDSEHRELPDKPALWAHRREWLIAGAVLVVLVAISLVSTWNGPQGAIQRGRIAGISFAPDGRSVLLSRSHGKSSFLYKVTLATGESVRLTRAASGIETSPAYSPDGRLVVFLYATSPQERPHIFIMDTNDNSIHALFSSRVDAEDLSPRFTPDGTRIYFARMEASSDLSTSVPSASQTWDIYSADLKGENLQPLTDRHFQPFSALSFSRDGKKLLYSTDGQSGSELHLYSLDEPSEPERKLEPHVSHLSGSPVYANAALSPDGRQVYFLAASSQGNEAFDYDVYRLGLADNSIEKLTAANGYATDLCISADGTSAVFLRWTSRWGSLPNINKMYLLNLATKSLSPVNVTGTD
jgi:Tol biopolymer transport system component